MYEKGFPGGANSKNKQTNKKNHLAMQEMQVGSLGWEYALEEGIATHSSILAWRIPWTEEPGGYSPYSHTELDMTERI